MHSTVFFAFLVADISALMIFGTISNTVDMTDERVFSNSIAKSIETASQSIKDTALDPLSINKTHVAIDLPVAVLINSRFNFDIELPLINLSVGAASVKAMLLSSSLNVKALGKMSIESVRITGQIHVNISVFSGISIRRVNMNFTLRDIVSDIKLVIQGKDYSAKVNNFIESTVPNTIKSRSVNCSQKLIIICLAIFQLCWGQLPV